MAGATTRRAFPTRPLFRRLKRAVTLPPIYAVQGSSLTSPLAGAEVAVEVVVGDTENNGVARQW